MTTFEHWLIHSKVMDAVTLQARARCGNWLALRRQQLGLMDEQVAELTGLSPQTLVLLETGLADETIITEDIEQRLSIALSKEDHDVELVAVIIAAAIGRGGTPNNQAIDRFLTDIRSTDENIDEDTEEIL